jgi:alpha-ketoglutarate-dependent taurine dioxygenase
MAAVHADPAVAGGEVRARHPFDLDDDATYRRWRAWKLRQRAADASALCVPVQDLCVLTPGERGQLLATIGRHGVALYSSPHREEASDLPHLQAASLPRALGAQLGLVRLHANWLAGEDGISPITVHVPAAGANQAGEAAEASATRSEFIPYTDRAIGWHTDGYYQAADRRILGMILHCVRPAAEGGETALADPERLYIALRDEDSALVRALMHPQAMSIPAREGEGGIARAEQTGPVFSLVDVPGGVGLHMRYTARTRSIRWRDDAATRAAAARITALLAGGEFVLRQRLEAGMGLVGHNVLHLRTAFTDDPAAPRLLYRARFLDRIAVPVEHAWREPSQRLGG